MLSVLFFNISISPNPAHLSYICTSRKNIGKRSRKMKRGIAAIALAMVLLLSWVVPAAAHDSNNNQNGSWGGGSYWGSTWGTSFFYKIGSGTVTAQLIAGKTPGKVGMVTVWENEGNINVQFDVSAGWNLTETALGVGRGMTCDIAESKIAQKMGNYNPDKFPYRKTFDEFTSSCAYSIEEGALGRGNWLCIAAYAELQTIDDSTKTYKAWGDLSPMGAWKLPKTPITIKMDQFPDYNNHTFGIELSNVGAGYSVHNGVYAGWCADYDTTFGSHTDPFTATLYSSLNLSHVPTYLKDVPWDMLNYVVNHYDPTVDYYDVQLAIWYFTNTGIEQTTASQTLVDDALAHGTGFVPGPGQVGAVIIDRGQWQLIFIELYAPTGCYRESSCRHDCTPNWSPCSQSWNPSSSCSQDWDPKWTPCSQKWNSKYTPQNCGDIVSHFGKRGGPHK
jgi:hypothetical protein